MPELSDNELIKMQNDAMKRVQEMQKRARLTYDAAQGNPAPTAPTTVPTVPTVPGEKAAPSASPRIGDEDLPRLLLSLLSAAGDPVLNAALSYLLM